MFALSMLIVGAAAGGFVNGLSGFGTALFALAFWLQAFEPRQAVAMAVALAVIAGLPGLWLVRREIAERPSRLARFLAPAALGAPLGVILLDSAEPGPMRLLIGGALTLYGLFFAMRRALPSLERSHRLIDPTIGFLAGGLGGFAGLSGVLPAMWCALLPWSKGETRALLQPFNAAVLAMSAAILAAGGAYDAETLARLAIALPIGAVAAHAGGLVYRRLDDAQFKGLLVGLLCLSGIALLLREAI